MSLVKIRNPPINSDNGILDEPFNVRFQNQLIIKPYSTVELINFGCRLQPVYAVNFDEDSEYNTLDMLIKVYDKVTAGYLGETNIPARDLIDGMYRRTFLDDFVIPALNAIDRNLDWTWNLNVGQVNDSVIFYWTSIDGITTYDLVLEFSANFGRMGFPTSANPDDLPGAKLTGIISAPNAMQLDVQYPRNLTIELLNFGQINSFDSVSHYKDPICLFIPSVTGTREGDNKSPLVSYIPSTPIRIKLDNEYEIKVNDLQVRVMTDVEIDGKIVKEYAEITTFCAMTLSFKEPREL